MNIVDDEPEEDREEFCEWNRTINGVMEFCDAPGGDMVGEYSYCVVHAQEIRGRLAR